MRSFNLKGFRAFYEKYSEEDLRMLKKEIEIQLKDAKKEVEAIIDKNIKYPA